MATYNSRMRVLSLGRPSSGCFCASFKSLLSIAGGSTEKENLNPLFIEPKLRMGNLECQTGQRHPTVHSIFVPLDCKDFDSTTVEATSLYSESLGIRKCCSPYSRVHTPVRHAKNAPCLGFGSFQAVVGRNFNLHVQQRFSLLLRSQATSLAWKHFSAEQISCLEAALEHEQCKT